MHSSDFEQRKYIHILQLTFLKIPLRARHLLQWLNFNFLFPIHVNHGMQLVITQYLGPCHLHGKPGFGLALFGSVPVDGTSLHSLSSCHSAFQISRYFFSMFIFTCLFGETCWQRSMCLRNKERSSICLLALQMPTMARCGTG